MPEKRASWLTGAAGQFAKREYAAVHHPQVVVIEEIVEGVEDATFGVVTEVVVRYVDVIFQDGHWTPELVTSKWPPHWSKRTKQELCANEIFRRYEPIVLLYVSPEQVSELAIGDTCILDETTQRPIVVRSACLDNFKVSRGLVLVCGTLKQRQKNKVVEALEIDHTMRQWWASAEMADRVEAEMSLKLPRGETVFPPWVWSLKQAFTLLFRDYARNWKDGTEIEDTRGDNMEDEPIVHVKREQLVDERTTIYTVTVTIPRGCNLKRQGANDMASILQYELRTMEESP